MRAYGCPSGNVGGGAGDRNGGWCMAGMRCVHSCGMPQPCPAPVPWPVPVPHALASCPVPIRHITYGSGVAGGGVPTSGYGCMGSMGVCDFSKKKFYSHTHHHVTPCRTSAHHCPVAPGTPLAGDSVAFGARVRGQSMGSWGGAGYGGGVRTRVVWGMWGSAHVAPAAQRGPVGHLGPFWRGWCGGVRWAAGNTRGD